MMAEITCPNCMKGSIEVDEDGAGECPECQYVHDPLDCDDEACEAREGYEVTVERTVIFRVMAHTEDEANAIVWNLPPVFDVSEPHSALVEDFNEGDEDLSIRSEETIRRERAEMQERFRQFEAERAEQEAQTSV